MKIKALLTVILSAVLGGQAFAADATAPATTQPTKAATTIAKAEKLAPGQLVNINTASVQEIEKLPEIGPKKAAAIIAARPFSKPEDIMKVKGIKVGVYKKIQPLITVK